MRKKHLTITNIKHKNSSLFSNYKKLYSLRKFGLLGQA